ATTGWLCGTSREIFGRAPWPGPETGPQRGVTWRGSSSRIGVLVGRRFFSPFGIRRRRLLHRGIWEMIPQQRVVLLGDPLAQLPRVGRREGLECGLVADQARFKVRALTPGQTGGELFQQETLGQEPGP